MAKIHDFDKKCGLFGIHSIQMAETTIFEQHEEFHAKSRISMNSQHIQYISSPNLLEFTKFCG